jgi:hypothetical protein
MANPVANRSTSDHQVLSRGSPLSLSDLDVIVDSDRQLSPSGQSDSVAKS